MRYQTQRRSLVHTRTEKEENDRIRRHYLEERLGIEEGETPRFPFLPETLLLVALLRATICDYLFGNKHAADEAEVWIFGEPCGSDTQQFTFDAVCEYLKLNSEAVREGIEHLRERKVESQLGPSITRFLRFKASLSRADNHSATILATLNT